MSYILYPDPDRTCEIDLSVTSGKVKSTKKRLEFLVDKGTNQLVRVTTEHCETKVEIIQTDEPVIGLLEINSCFPRRYLLVCNLNIYYMDCRDWDDTQITLIENRKYVDYFSFWDLGWCYMEDDTITFVPNSLGEHKICFQNVTKEKLLDGWTGFGNREDDVRHENRTHVVSTDLTSRRIFSMGHDEVIVEGRDAHGKRKLMSIIFSDAVVKSKPRVSLRIGDHQTLNIRPTVIQGAKTDLHSTITPRVQSVPLFSRAKSARK